MLLALVDLETVERNVVEMSMLLFCTESRTRVFGTTALIKDSKGTPMPCYEHTMPIHKIPHAAVEKWGLPLAHREEGKDDKILLSEFIAATAPTLDVSEISFVVAHSAAFEKRFIVTDIPWLCSYRDLDLLPKGYNGSRKLIEIALYYRIPISTAHRSFEDADLIASILCEHRSIDALIIEATKPRYEWLAPIPKALPEHVNPPEGFSWNRQQTGWIGKPEGELAKLVVDTNYLHGGFSFVQETERVRVATKDCPGFSTYFNKEKLKEWGFIWDRWVKGSWARLIDRKAIEAVKRQTGFYFEINDE